MGHLLSRLSKKAGFTLIELLVVIAIIAVLSTIGLSAFTSAQQRARDARRRGDMKAMQDSFEQYYVANNNAYGANCGAMATYLQGSSLPTDPKSGWTAYSCTVTAGPPQTYCACALLENTTTGNSGANCNFGAATKDYHCVRNLQ